MRPVPGIERVSEPAVPGVPNLTAAARPVYSLPQCGDGKAAHDHPESQGYAKITLCVNPSL